MKTCSRCLVDKPEEQFRWRNKAKGWRAPWCKTCFAIYEQEKWSSDANRRRSNIDASTKRRTRNAQFVWDYLKGNPCPCGETDPMVLEFDHRDPKQKSANVSEMIRQGYSTETILKEAQKCDVLCAICHRRKTAEQFGWYKDIIK